MKRILTALFTGLLVSVMTCGSVWAQATAQISGIVRDQSGAVLPGVEVTGTQTDTGISRMTVTSETGSYVLPNLALGAYRLEAGLPGFRTFIQTGIVLQVNSNSVINVVLEVGQVTEQVEVQANASLVETRIVGVGRIMETERIVELPLNGRNAQELMLLAGGAVAVPLSGSSTFPGRLLISSTGALGPSTDYALDGIRHVDPWDGQGMPLPFPDALAEFKTEPSGLNAQQSRSSAVRAVTKSGTNAFHGALFEFVRNDLFNARNYFATTHSTLKRNQLGAPSAARSSGISSFSAAATKAQLSARIRPTCGNSFPPPRCLPATFRPSPLRPATREDRSLTSSRSRQFLWAKLPPPRETSGLLPLEAYSAPSEPNARGS